VKNEMASGRTMYGTGKPASAAALMVWARKPAYLY
jgi:hypothetical protein